MYSFTLSIEEYYTLLSILFSSINAFKRQSEESTLDYLKEHYSSRADEVEVLIKTMRDRIKLAEPL